MTIECISLAAGRVVLSWQEYESSADALLSAGERALIAGTANESRRIQFALGRGAARKAISFLGGDASESVLADDKGMPLWPKGLVGSISHCYRYSPEQERLNPVAVAAVGLVSELRSVGIDIESTDRPLRPNTHKAIAFGPERDWVQHRDMNSRTIALLSAKECLYKLLFPLTRTYFGMKEALLSWSEGESQFQAILQRDLNTEFTKGWKTDLRISRQQQLCLALAAI